MIFHGLQYTSTVIAILNILSAILILHISDCLEHLRLSPVWCSIQSPLCPRRLSLTWPYSPSVPELPWTFKVVSDLVNLWPPVSKAMLPWWHPISTRTPMVQVSELLTYDGSHVSRARLQVSQRPQCDDKAHVCVTDNNVFTCAIIFSSERHRKV